MKCASIFSLVLCGIAAAAQPTAEQQVRDEFQRCIGAFVGGDADTFTGCFAEDITLFNPEIPEAPSQHRMDGRAAVAEYFRGLIAGAHQRTDKPPYFNVQPKNIAVQMLGDAALVSFEFDREGGSLGRRSFVFAQRDGHWRIVHIHASNTTGRGSIH
jgi:hypothetical protein